MPHNTNFDTSDLSPAERSHLAREFLVDAGSSDSEPELSPALRAELDRRLEAHRLDPGAVETLEVVEAEILAYLAGRRASTDGSHVPAEPLELACDLESGVEDVTDW